MLVESRPGTAQTATHLDPLGSDMEDLYVKYKVRISPPDCNVDKYLFLFALLGFKIGEKMKALLNYHILSHHKHYG